MPTDLTLLSPLKTARLLLRCVQSGDATVLSRLMTPAVSQTLGSWTSPLSIETAAQLIVDRRAEASLGDAVPLIVAQVQDNQVVGWVGIKRQSEPGVAKLGYWMGEEYQGRGYAKEAVPAAIQLGFDLLGVDSIEAAVEVENIASIKVLQRCGLLLLEKRMIMAPSQGREHLCEIYRAKRP